MSKGSARPGWAEQGEALLAPALPSLSLGALWALQEGLAALKEAQDLPALEEDFAVARPLGALWARLEARAREVEAALLAARAALEAQLRTGALPPDAFRSTFEQLGFEELPGRASTPADDFLDGLFGISRLSTAEERGAFAQVNLSSRARRISELLALTRPGAQDVLFDLGSGSGKVALTVAASTQAQVVGVELGPSYVEWARACAARLALHNARFVCEDARTTALEAGTVFYLFHPFWGAAAQEVAGRLAGLARRKRLTVYAQGPDYGFGEHFLAHVASGAFQLQERRGEFGEVFILRSA